MQYQKRKRIYQSLVASVMVLCLAVLGFAVWLLFVPNAHNRPVVQTQTDIEEASGTAALPVETTANQFAAVLTGNTTQLAGAADETWTSSDETIAQVDENGVVTGLQPGRCTITGDKGDVYQVAVRHLEQRDGCTYVDDILIVNKTYSLPETYDPGLEPVAEGAFTQLQAAAAAEGLELYIGSDYRDYAYQVKIYQNYCDLYGWEEADTFSARPGHSEHQSGLTIDCNTIDDAFGETPEAAWLAQHCAVYGFIIRFPLGKEHITGYQYEPWHIRYVGSAVAQEIQQYDLTLEEYLGVTSAYTEPWQG